jgi:hypothetical protein
VPRSNARCARACCLPRRRTATSLRRCPPGAAQSREPPQIPFDRRNPNPDCAGHIPKGWVDASERLSHQVLAPHRALCGRPWVQTASRPAAGGGPPNARTFEDYMVFALWGPSSILGSPRNRTPLRASEVPGLKVSEPLWVTPARAKGTRKPSLPNRVVRGSFGTTCEMVPQGRIELPTSPLPRVRSTTELLRHRTGQNPVCAVD